MAGLFSKIIKNQNNKILLAPSNDGSWTAEVGRYAGPNGVLLTDEGKYPVELYYSRMDINGSSVMEMDICRNRNELLSSLNWIGIYGHTLKSLWGYHSDQPVSKDLADIFEASYVRKCRIIKEAADEMYAAFSEDEFFEEPKDSLNAKIQDADSRSFNFGAFGSHSKSEQGKVDR